MTKERAISHLKDISMWGIVQADEYNALKMAIAELQKKPKTSHWVDCYGWYKCDNCLSDFKFPDDDLFQYCPRCGCRMKGENE